MQLKQLKKRCGGILKNKEINFFSTKVNTSIFKYSDKDIVRNELGLDRNRLIFVTTGRIHHTKGWRFLLDVVSKYKNENRDCLLIFVGDGGDRKMMELEISNLKIENNVLITGFMSPDNVAKYIQAADLFLLGSQKEGWSTSLIEALACYRPIVTTKVSSATTIVKEGVNGFVVEQNDIIGFIEKIDKALHLPAFTSYVENEIQKYSLGNLKNSLEKIWNPEGS
ncbi:glycosyl transferase group 1 [sediment metagenome]|uniref:Glycosyl transferase group 1 n=1 Tax=sediment metagenome TaxID=749907 RepID=D9PHX6_9ZZZZ